MIFILVTEFLCAFMKATFVELEPMLWRKMVITYYWCFHPDLKGSFIRRWHCSSQNKATPLCHDAVMNMISINLTIWNWFLTGTLNS